MDELRTERLVGTRPLLRDGDESPFSRAELIAEMAHWRRHRCGCWVWRRDGKVVALAGLRATGEVELRYLAEPGLEAELRAAIEGYRSATNAAS
jgi:hypothetical protein